MSSWMFKATQLSPCGAVSRRRRWRGRFFMTASVMTVCYVCADYWTANSLTRSLRAVTTTAYVAYLYKTTSPTTLQEFSGLHSAAAEAVLDLCLRNEGLYIKLGQGLNALNHILPGEYMDVLKTLLDSAPLVPIKDVKQIIKEETGRTVEELFLDFDPVPVASASVAQVHRAKLRPASEHDGPLEVAVKVQKPQVRYQVFWDLETYRFITWFMGLLFDLPVGWARQTIMDGIRREIDFSIEAKNAECIRENFEGHPSVYVPWVVKDLTTPRLLVTEWVDGVKLINVGDVRRQFEDVTVLRTIFDAFGDMIFKHGFVHCDPHGANVLVRPAPCSSSLDTREKKCKKPQVVLLDFGLCCPETEQFRVKYALLFKSIVMQDIKTVKKIVTSWGITDAEVFASIQMQKPYKSLKRGNRGEVTREEVLKMHMAARQSVRTLLENQELVPHELSLVGRSIDILRGINRLYGAPLNRVDMFVRRAVEGLGTISTYEDAQCYLAQLGDSCHTTGREGTTSVFDAAAEQLRAKQTAALFKYRMRCNASLRVSLCETIVSVYRRCLFELMMCLIQIYCTTVNVYHILLETCLSTLTAQKLRWDSLEDILERRENCMIP